jgi:hypothetical protein
MSRIATVSCHVERPLDDACWAAFADLQARRPGGFEIAALMRPPEPDESESLWLARARIAAAHGPFGHHTHWGGAAQARPTEGNPAQKVREQAAWLRERGLEPKLFCGGAWYMDEEVATTVSELGYTDCTATAFWPSYLPPGAPRVELAAPAVLRLGDRRLTEVPSTHSLGMAVRVAASRLPDYVHVYFHDTDLLVPRRRRALAAALTLIGRRRRPVRLDAVPATAETEFSAQVRE